MTIETKFNVAFHPDPGIWFMYLNKPMNKLADEIRIIHIRGQGTEIKYRFRLVGLSDVWVGEKDIFATKEELLKSL